MIRKQGPLRAYSGRSMERTIGEYKKLIKSKVDAGANAGNILERLTLYNYVHSLDFDLDDTIGLLQPRMYNSSSYISLDPYDALSSQLWSPINEYSLSKLPCDVTNLQFETALARFYNRTRDLQESPLLMSESLKIAGRCWFDNVIYSSLLYKTHIREKRRGNHYIMFNVLHKR